MLTSSYLSVLLLTLVMETFVAFVSGYRDKLALLSVIFINLITNPLLNYFLWINGYFHFIGINISNILILETMVVFIEWGLLIFALKQKPWRLFALSLVMNSASFGAGLVFLR